MHLVIIGAGVFGAWTAHHVLSAGAGVTLVDAYGSANSRASSGDESRILRCGYGPDEIYSRWARQSLRQWRELSARAGARPPLFHECGVLWLAGDDAYTRATRDTLARGGHPIEVLDPGQLTRRYPHIDARGIDVGLLEPDCGVLMARRAVHTLVADLETRGARVVRDRAFVSRPSGGLRAISTAASGEIAGDAFVFACGPWLPKVFPDLLAGRIRPTRQVVVYFGVPPGDSRFGAAQTPAWVDFPAGIYGVPDLEHRGVKVGIDRHGPPIDPDTDDRVADAESIEMARAWLGRRIPALADAPVVESRVCQYENTSTGDFLIDRHPDFDNVWIAGGGSGHGFKHGPAVGEYVAGLVLRTVSPESRFALATKGTAAQRSVY
jgi:sarcosine oxidase